MTPKKILMIAGPNGAGKTTFATEFLPNEADSSMFINADLIAAGINPFRPAAAAIRSGRLMIGLIHDYVRNGESFAFETTLSGQGYLRLIPTWQDLGYLVSLVFLRLVDPEVAIARVRQRVSEGGLDVPEPVIRRRFHSGLRNFECIYRDMVDEWAVYDASGESFILLEDGRRP